MNDERELRAVYVISVAAELAGVHPQTLRIYERRGLLAPSRTGGGSRRYSERDIAQLRRIQELTAAGINIAGVQQILDLELEVERLKAMLAETQREAVRMIDEARRSTRRDLVPLRQMPDVWRPNA
jgi:MerR family transcriptional regulator/heat shock protein HspR